MVRRAAFSLLIAVLLVSVFCVPVYGHCEEQYSPEQEITEQLDELLEEYDIGSSFDELKDIQLTDIAEQIRERMRDRLRAPLRLLGELLIITVFTAVLKSFGGTLLSDSVSELYDTICVITAVTVISSQLFGVLERTLTVMERGGGFVTVFVPVFAAITAVCGGTFSAGVYDLLILGASEVFVTCAERWLMPVLSMIMVLSVSGSVFPERSLSSLTELIHKGAVWCITVSMSLFTGFLGLKCTISGKTDGFAVKAAKFAISGAVPIVGGAVSDAYSTVRGSFEIIRGGIGLAGTAAMLLIMLPPVLELAAYRIVLKIGAAAADIFGAEAVSRLLNGFGSAAEVAQCLMVCYSLMFMICTALMLRSVG